jgi:hypothetical protein
MNRCFVDGRGTASPRVGLLFQGPNKFRPMGLARRLGVSWDRVRHWLRSGYLSVGKDEDGHAIV